MALLCIGCQERRTERFDPRDDSLQRGISPGRQGQEPSALLTALDRRLRGERTRTKVKRRKHHIYASCSQYIKDLPCR